MSQGPTGLPQDILEDARALFDFNQLHHELRPPRATNTRENIEFSRQLMAEYGLQPESAVLICRPYQQRRAYATCRQVWPALDVICASDPRPLDDYLDGIRDPGFVISMMVGDTQRVIEYPKLGPSVPQEV